MNEPTPHPDPDASRRPGPGDQAVALFETGYNCAESVVIAVARRLGLDGGEPERLATGFGGGMARRGLVCGCLTGSALALGLAAGRRSGDDDTGKERVYTALERVMGAFEARFGSLDCRRLTGLDFSLPESHAAFDATVKDAVCVHLVRWATEAVLAEVERSTATA